MRTYENNGPDIVHGPWSKDTMETMCDNFDVKGITYKVVKLPNNVFRVITNEVSSDRPTDTKYVSFKMPADTYQRIRIKAIKEGTNVAELCRGYLTEWLAEQG